MLDEGHEKKTDHVLTVTIVSNDLDKSPFAIMIPLQVPFPRVQDPTLKEKDIDKEIRKLWKSLLKVLSRNALQLQSIHGLRLFRTFKVRNNWHLGNYKLISNSFIL